MYSSCIVSYQNLTYRQTLGSIFFEAMDQLPGALETANELDRPYTINFFNILHSLLIDRILRPLAPQYLGDMPIGDPNEFPSGYSEICSYFSTVALGLNSISSQELYFDQCFPLCTEIIRRFISLSKSTLPPQAIVMYISYGYLPDDSELVNKLHAEIWNYYDSYPGSYRFASRRHSFCLLPDIAEDAKSPDFDHAKVFRCGHRVMAAIDWLTFCQTKFEQASSSRYNANSNHREEDKKAVVNALEALQRLYSSMEQTPVS